MQDMQIRSHSFVKLVLSVRWDFTAAQ